jgi:hypothetical protein
MKMLFTEYLVGVAAAAAAAAASALSLQLSQELLSNKWHLFTNHSCLDHISKCLTKFSNITTLFVLAV